MAVRVFPVEASGKPTFSDTWGAARGGGTRTHQGVDIFAPAGTPVLAVEDGVVRQGSNELGGLVAVLQADDGTRYYYAHLLAYVGESPRRVKAGDPIGQVGNSGNARGTPPHLHFEIRHGSTPTNPFPELVAVAPSRPRSAPATGAGGIVFLLLAYALSRR